MIKQIIILLYLTSFSLSITLPSSYTLAHNLTLSCSLSNLRGDQPAGIRDDYTYTAGVGAHKVHDRIAKWNVARRTCVEEGGHLLIVNSIAEANAIVNLLKETVPSWDAVWIGFHDLFEEGEYVTLHGESLAKTGFSRWASGEPNNYQEEDCGGFHYRGGFLYDLSCNNPHPFVCELPVQ